MYLFTFYQAQKLMEIHVGHMDESNPTLPPGPCSKEKISALAVAFRKLPVNSYFLPIKKQTGNLSLCCGKHLNMCISKFLLEISVIGIS